MVPLQLMRFHLPSRSPPSRVSPALPRLGPSHNITKSPKPETLPLVEDVEREDEHDVEPDHTKGPRGSGRGVGHSRVTAGRGGRAAQGTPGRTLTSCLGAPCLPT